MTFPTAHDHVLTAIGVAEVISVVAFGWACVLTVNSKSRYFNGRFAACLLILVPCTLEALIRLNDEIRIASFYPTDDFYTNLHRILKVRWPLVIGLFGFSIMLAIHSIFWWFQHRPKPVTEISLQS
jgi:hypothetical protein